VKKQRSVRIVHGSVTEDNRAATSGIKAGANQYTTTPIGGLQEIRDPDGRTASSIYAMIAGSMAKSGNGRTRAQLSGGAVENATDEHLGPEDLPVPEGKVRRTKTRTDAGNSRPDNLAQTTSPVY